VTVAVATAVWLTAGTALAVAASAVAGGLWLVARDLARRREASAARAEARAALRILVGELEVGTGAAAALAGAAEVAPRFAVVLHAAAVAAASGADPAAVLAQRPELRTLGLAWRVGADTGIALAGVLARVEADLAAADEQHRAVSVALAGPRASAVVLATLPLLGLGLGAAMGARPWAFLFGSGAGQIVCCAGVLLDVGGVLWLRTILRRAEAS
jgi:tight adherence protein B